jgi:hypothetical protein
VSEQESKRKRSRVGGVWVAYHADWSGLSIHSSELAALRAAVDRSQAVMFWPFNMDRADAVAADDARRRA